MLADLLLSADEKLDTDIVGAFKEHLFGLSSQLGVYFAEIVWLSVGQKSVRRQNTHWACCFQTATKAAMWKSHQTRTWRQQSEKMFDRLLNPHPTWASGAHWLLWDCGFHFQSPTIVKPDFPHLLLDVCCVPPDTQPCSLWHSTVSVEKQLLLACNELDDTLGWHSNTNLVVDYHGNGKASKM